ncbi:7-cyano-7-deazaguanine synthase [Evansella sp. LMS18]|uniref:7-cyano-7-deazaguanine synthase n=1 Tax=Evansella sp. LMS18 TaxID=2924033 RepID=UPI0020D0AE6A|nr:7-cyano-7-deazaguanine synthase [Evansella sp. LMS18]UTR12733.1 7-cyano-7-deazaguanine synthase [Evansella sp. LMS18]
MNNKTVTILLSGGLDSTALIKFYKLKGYTVKGIHFQYGQSTAKTELKSVKNISEYYDLEVVVKNIGFKMNTVNNEVLCRNGIFIFSAATSFEVEDSNTLAIGIHSGTPYYDCSEEFVFDSQKILDGYFGGTLLLEAPFIHSTKEEIFKFILHEGIPVHLTYSCEKREFSECGKCLSCLDRRYLVSEYKKYM